MAKRMGKSIQATNKLIRCGDIVLIRSKGIIPALIRWWTRSSYNHCGIAINKDTMIEANYPRVRLRNIPSNAVCFRYKRGISKVALDVMNSYLEARLGKKYDWLGLLSFVTRTKWHNKSYYFCSELVAEAYEKAGLPLLRRSPSMVSPQDIYQSLELREVKRADMAKSKE